MEEFNILPTYIETLSLNFQLILEDLQRVEPQDVAMYPPPYDDLMTLEMKFSSTKRTFLRAKRTHNRVQMMTNAYYLGKLIETIEDPITRTVYSKKISGYYYRTAVRIYYLFEFLGPSQIARTHHATLKMIERLTVTEYNTLVEKATDIFAGTQNLEGE